MSLDFNNNLISANPAKAFFDRPVIQGENMEIGPVFSQAGDPENKAIEQLILDPDVPPAEVIKTLDSKGVKYVLIYDFGLRNDYLVYPFLQSAESFKTVFKNDLTLLQIMVQ